MASAWAAPDGALLGLFERGDRLRERFAEATGFASATGAFDSTRGGRAFQSRDSADPAHARARAAAGRLCAADGRRARAEAGGGARAGEARRFAGAEAGDALREHTADRADRGQRHLRIPRVAVNIDLAVCIAVTSDW